MGNQIKPIIGFMMDTRIIDPGKWEYLDANYVICVDLFVFNDVVNGTYIRSMQLLQAAMKDIARSRLDDIKYLKWHWEYLYIGLEDETQIALLRLEDSPLYLATTRILIKGHKNYIDLDVI